MKNRIKIKYELIEEREIDITDIVKDGKFIKYNDILKAISGFESNQDIVEKTKKRNMRTCISTVIMMNMEKKIKNICEKYSLKLKNA